MFNFSCNDEISNNYRLIFTFDPFAATNIITVKDDLKSINLNVPNAVFAPDMRHVKSLYCTWTGAKMCQRVWIPGRPFNIVRRLFTCNMIHRYKFIGAHCLSNERAFCSRFIHNIHIHSENSILISFLDWKRHQTSHLNPWPSIQSLFTQHTSIILFEHPLRNLSLS